MVSFTHKKCPTGGGLYAEKFNATVFTIARANNRQNWFYRIRHSAVHGDFQRIDNGLIRSAPITEIKTPPSQLRWDPSPIPDEPRDFIDGMITIAANDNVGATRVAIHMYLANQSMDGHFFYNIDGVSYSTSTGCV